MKKLFVAFGCAVAVLIATVVIIIGVMAVDIIDNCDWDGQTWTDCE